MKHKGFFTWLWLADGRIESRPPHSLPILKVVFFIIATVALIEIWALYMAIGVLTIAARWDR